MIWDAKALHLPLLGGGASQVMITNGIENTDVFVAEFPDALTFKECFVC